MHANGFMNVLSATLCLNPKRVIAAYIALFLVGYVASYLWAVVSRWDWQERLRQSNLYMALGVCVGGLFWLTPVMNAEAISANNQLARFQSGKTKLDDVPAYEMAHDWGVAGRVALEALAAGGDEQVLARVKAAKEAGYELKVGRFPFIGNGKAIALGEPEGMIKTVFDAKTGELLGAHMVGAEVTELIQGYVVGRQLETTEEDLMNTVFPHPTLSEMMHEAVLDAYGRAIHF